MGELMKVGAQAHGAFEASKGFLGLKQNHGKLPNLGGTERAIGFEYVVAQQFSGLSRALFVLRVVLPFTKNAGDFCKIKWMD